MKYTSYPCTPWIAFGKLVKINLKATHWRCKCATPKRADISSNIQSDLPQLAVYTSAEFPFDARAQEMTFLLTAVKLRRAAIFYYSKASHIPSFPDRLYRHKKSGYPWEFTYSLVKSKSEHQSLSEKKKPKIHTKPRMITYKSALVM